MIEIKDLEKSVNDMVDELELIVSKYDNEDETTVSVDLIKSIIKYREYLFDNGGIFTKDIVDKLRLIHDNISLKIYGIKVMMYEPSMRIYRRMARLNKSNVDLPNTMNKLGVYKMYGAILDDLITTWVKELIYHDNSLIEKSGLKEISSNVSE